MTTHLGVSVALSLQTFLASPESEVPPGGIKALGPQWLPRELPGSLCHNVDRNPFPRALLFWSPSGSVTQIKKWVGRIINALFGTLIEFPCQFMPRQREFFGRARSISAEWL